MFLLVFCIQCKNLVQEGTELSSSYLVCWDSYLSRSKFAMNLLMIYISFFNEFFRLDFSRVQNLQIFQGIENWTENQLDLELAYNLKLVNSASWGVWELNWKLYLELAQNLNLANMLVKLHAGDWQSWKHPLRHFNKCSRISSQHTYAGS